MQVVEVIPIVRGLPKATLSYFTKERLPLGSFVRVPVRSGTTLGIVSATLDAKAAKARLKSEDFSLRKLSAAPSAYSLSPAFLRAAETTAGFYGATVGSIIGALIPKALLESPDIFQKNGRKPKAASGQEVKLIQLSKDERYREYRGLVRERFAKKESVMLIVPSKEDLIKATQALSAGIEQYVYTVENGSAKKIRKLLIKARDEKHPILFICTPSFIAFDRPDLGAYILERENSRAYRTLARPFIHIKTFLEHYACERGATLILGDSLLSLETLWREKEGWYSEFTPLTWRLKGRSETQIVDMRARKGFEIFSPNLAATIKDVLARRGSIFLFGARKGLSGTTICEDCSSLLLCKNCGAPMVLHGGPIYICRRCAAKRSAETRCDYCQSWKLKPLGIGVDRIAAEVRKLFPDAEVSVLDKEHASTAPQARTIAKRFAENGGILVGTEMALNYVNGADVAACVSLDSLFSLPDFSVNERIFYLITRLRETARERFVLQTRNAGEDTLTQAAAGNILDFYRTEILEREELRYPPFSIFVKVSIEDTPERIEYKAGELQKFFVSYHPHFILEKKESTRMLSMIMRFPRDAWPKKEIVEKLLLLTPEFTVKVDPEGIL